MEFGIFQFLNCNFYFSVFNFQFSISNLKSESWNFKFASSNLNFQILSSRCQTANFICQISYFKHEIIVFRSKYHNYIIAMVSTFQNPKSYPGGRNMAFPKIVISRPECDCFKIKPSRVPILCYCWKGVCRRSNMACLG